MPQLAALLGPDFDFQHLQLFVTPAAGDPMPVGISTRAHRHMPIK